MSQDVSSGLQSVSQNAPSDQPLGEAFGVGAVSPSGEVPVESYADRLMDDLFEDVEEILGGGLKSAPETESVEEPSPRSPSPNLLNLPFTTRFRSIELPRSEFQLDSATPGVDRQTGGSLLTKATTVIEKFRHRARSYDRLLLKVGCISLITTLVLWLLFREASQQQPASAPAPTQTTASANVEPNSQFSEYMQQSLQAIDQKTQASNPTGIASNVPAGSMPSVIVPGSPTPGIAPPGSTTGVPNSAPSTRLATGLERVYGSTYRLPQNLPSGNSPTLAPPVAPLPSALPKVATAPVKPPLPLQIPGVAHTLVGVVDLGEQSAILVEVNGVAQRFRLGESIGSSGWALVEVSKNQAIIRRNGEVRSVFIGQNF